VLFKKKEKKKKSILDVKPEKVLEINQKAGVNVLSGDYEGTYNTRIEDIIVNEKLYLAVPTDDHGTHIPLVSGTPMDVDVLTSQGRFKFRAKVAGKRIEGNIAMLEINYPQKLIPEQLREFFRVPVRLKIKIFKYYEDVPDANMKIPFKSFDANLIDISGGGGRFISNADFETGDQFNIDLSEISPELEKVQCQAVRVRQLESKFETSFKFLLEKESDRNFVVRYAFKRQIELKDIGSME